MFQGNFISSIRRFLRNCSRVQAGDARGRRERGRMNTEPLEARALLSAVAWDGGAGTLNWADAANWDTDTVPGAGDDVTIDVAGENTINVAGVFTVASFSSQESIYINGGQLTTNGSSSVAGNFGMRADTTFTVDGVGSVFTAPATSHWELGNLTARNGAVINLSAVNTASNGFDGAGTTWRATGANSRIDLSGLSQFSGYGRNGQLVITAADGGAIDLSGATSIPGGTTQMSSFGTGSLIDISAVETWADGNRQRSSTVAWGDGGTIDVSNLSSLIGVGAVATDGNVMTFPAVTRIGGDGDSTSNSRAEGVGSRLEFPAATSMDGPDRHGENAFRAIDGGVISLPGVTEIPGGTNRLEAFGAGSEIDVSALTFWNDTNFARSSNISWGDGGVVRVDVLETLRGVGVTANNGNVLTFPSVTLISGGGDSSSFSVADGAGSRIEFPAATTMEGPGRHGENSFQAINGGVISIPVLSVHNAGTTRMEAFGAGSEIDVSSLNTWTDNNFARSSNLSWGDGGIVKVDSLETLNSVNVTATAGNVLSFPALTRIGGVGDSTGIHKADGLGSRIEYPAVTVVDGPDRHGDTSFRAENGGFISLPSLTSIEHGAVSMSAFDTDGTGLGSEIFVPLLASWSNNNRHRDSAIRYGRGAEIDFSALTSMVGVSVYAADGDTVTLPVLETYDRAWDGAPRLDAVGANSRLSFPVLTALQAQTRNGRLHVTATDGATVDMPAVTSISGGPTLVLAKHADSNVLLTALETWSLDGRQPHASDAQADLGGNVTLGTTVVSGIPIRPNANSTITADTLTLASGAQLVGNGTLVGDVVNEGIIRPNNNAVTNIGTLTIDGGLTNSPGGTVEIGIGGTAAGTHDVLTVTGIAAIDGGTLDVSLVDGFEPAEGDSFSVFEFDDRICDFLEKNGTDLGNGLHLAASYSPTAMTLVTGTAPDSGQQCTTPPEITVQSSSIVVSEGDVAQNSGTFFDLEGPAVVVTSSVGTIVQDNIAGTWTWSFDTLDGPDGSRAVTVIATDSDGDETSATFTMTVNNVAPTVDTGFAMVKTNEGSVASNSGVFDDVGQDTVTISATVGTVTQDNVAGTWSWSFDTLDGPDDSQAVTITATDSDGAATETTFALTVDNVAPTASLNGPTEGDSGGSFSVTAATQDPAGTLDPLILNWNVTLDGQFFATQNGGDTYALNDAIPGLYLLTLSVDDGDGGTASATHSLSVVSVNQPPELSVAGPSQVVRGHARTFTFSATDADPADHDGPFEYTIDWGDGSPIEILTAGPELLIDHTFASSNAQGVTISATVSDSGQLESTVQQLTVAVNRWDVMEDPDSPGTTSLVIGGGLGDDTIRIRERRNDGKIRFRIHECDTGFVSHEVTDQAVDRILVYGQAGNDWIHVAQNVDAPTMLDGGEGDDTLVGGRGESILLGQAGNDWLFGGYGRGLLIGGTGGDRIFGWNRSDILVSGNTMFDNDLRSLDLIMREWTSDRSYSDRTANLQGIGTGVRSNENIFLRGTASATSPATVFDDDAKDRLWGFRGADWYFANVAGTGVIDSVFGERWWEVVTDLDRE